MKGLKQITKSVLLFAFCVSLFATPILAQSTESGQVKPTPAASPTNDVRERVRQKIENLTKKPKAIVGKLSEVTDSTLQIATLQGKEEMAAATESTTYVRINKGKRSEVKFEDLVIGDFIIAMGFKNGNNILEAKRVIAQDTNPLPQKRAFYGMVQSNEKGILRIKHSKTQETWTIETTTKTEVTKKTDGQKFEEIDVKEIQNGDRIIAVGLSSEKKDRTLDARKIHVIPDKAEGLIKPEPQE